MGVAAALGVRVPVDQRQSFQFGKRQTRLPDVGQPFQAAGKIARPTIDYLYERHSTKCWLSVSTVKTLAREHHGAVF